MNSKSVYNEIFDDNLIVKRVKNKLPKLFQLAELESSRDGKIGMEIGSVRERILIALLMFKYGIDIVNSTVRITEPAVDVFVKGEPLSIKTITTATSKLRGGVKLIWTVDAQKALEFQNSYAPKCDILLVQIAWKNTGRLCLFSKHSQVKILENIGRERYIKLPKAGTNPRGAEISQEALNLLLECEDTRTIEIPFIRDEIDYREIYTKWLDAWRKEF
ncbi:MAG: ThaI family type II restriction endonuclease [Firmicutes bacterium]|nr:ThaI family type II restriction endonuclease [Bacillota bacterium]